MALISGGTQSQENNKFKHSFSKEYQDSDVLLDFLFGDCDCLLAKSLNQQPQFIQFQLASKYTCMHVWEFTSVAYVGCCLSQGFMVGWLSLSS